MLNKYKFILLTVLVIIFLISDIILGSILIPINEAFSTLFNPSNTNSEWYLIIFEFRIPKAITAVLCGIGLSLSGLLMQSVFRNPLAGPYVLGISSGAGLGVALMLMGLPILGIVGNSIINDSLLLVSSFIGAAFILSIISFASKKINDITTILIIGIMFSSIAGALINIIQYFSDEVSLKSYIIWSMGSLGGVSKSQIYFLIPITILGTFLSVLIIKPLNALLIGESYAKSMGVNINKVRFIAFFSTTILAGALTAYCGPIAFIGIVTPHIARFIFNTSKHEILIPASILVGIIFMLFSDIVSQLPGCSNTLPINSITSLLGIPIILWIIIKNKKIGGFFA